MSLDPRISRLQQMPHGADLNRTAEIMGLDPDVILDFSGNINPYGFTPSIREAVLRDLETAMQYPDPQASRVRKRLAEYEELPETSLLLGNGGADLIFRTALAMRVSEDFKRRHDVIVVMPGFGEYKDAFSAAGFTIREHLLREEKGFELTEDILHELHPGVMAVVLCSPNNPTGKTVSPELLTAVRRRADELGIYLFADECFLEFLPRERAERLRLWADRSERLLTLHSLTKLYAIPALRAGWLYCADPELAEAIRRLTPPWQMSGPAQAAALAALDIPRSELELWRHRIMCEKESLAAALKDCGACMIQGEANYLFFKHEDPAFQVRLLDKPEPCILVRACANYPGLGPGWYRTAVRSPELNQKLIQKCREVYL